MNELLESIGRWWCRRRHKGAQNIKSGTYECPVCLRQIPHGLSEKWVYRDGIFYDVEV